MFYTVHLYVVVYISGTASFTSSVKSFLYMCGRDGRMGVCVCVFFCVCFMFVLCIYYVAIVFMYLFSAFALHYVFLYFLCMYLCT